MSSNPHPFPEGQYAHQAQVAQRPIKKKKRRFIKVLAFLLVITILSMTVANFFLDPVFISRLTKGFLFGFHTTPVAAYELENKQNLTLPTDKEIENFGKFAKKVSNRINLSLNSEQKEHFEDIKNGAKEITEFFRKIEANDNTSQNTTIATSGTNTESLSSAVLPQSHQETTETTLVNRLTSSLYLNLPSVVLNGSQNLIMKSEDEEEFKDIYDPDVLNDIGALLYANGYPELASAVTSMVAAEFPDDPRSALNFATILREANANEDAFHVLQYALKLSPDSEPILYSLGMCSLELKNTPYAEKCFMKILSLNSTSGPGHQGMMLCYMDTGDYSSAFLHMLEGAREGYTSMVTETYKALRQRNEEYFESIAKPIFEQYSMMQLMDFSKSRTPFDDTLDTPAGQLQIPREINLGRNSTDVYAASSILLSDGAQYGMSAFEHVKAPLEDALSMLEDLAGLTDEDGEVDGGELTKTISKMILKKVFDDAQSGQTVSSDGWLQISYEAEVFWLNILEDYTQIKVQEYLDEYFQEPYEEVFSNDDTLSPSLSQYNETFFKLADKDPLQAATIVLTNLVDNDSVYDSDVQKANKQDMDKFLQAVNPKLEEGYKKTADLMEEYWAYYGGVLGHIGNDETYNRYQQARKATVASALMPYVIGGTLNGFMITLNFVTVDPDMSGGAASIKLPSFPDFPSSQMGERYVPPAPPKPPVNEDPLDEEPLQEGSQEPEDISPEDGSDEKAEPDQQKPREGPITTEDSYSVSLGPFSVTINTETGYELDLTFIGSTNIRYNPKTRDLTLFGGIGASLGILTVGAASKTGVYSTINLKTGDITSGRRSTIEGQIFGNGVSVERQTCFATGADDTTVSAILMHKKSSQTIYNQ